MTDTGQIPGEGLPEYAGTAEQPPVYGYLSESPAEDEDLLLPGAQGAWGNEVAPPAPEPVVEAVHQPGPHETAGRDSGHVDLSGVDLTGARVVGGTPPGATPPGGTVIGGVVAGGPVSGGPVTGGVAPGGAVPGGPVTSGVVPGDAVTGGVVPGAAVPGGPVTGGPVPGDPVLSTASVPDFAVPPGGSVPDGPVPGGTPAGGTPVAGATPAAGTPVGATPPGGTPVATATPPAGTPVPGATPAAGTPVAPRRPLHLGPPTPDASASPVRSLADRGPAGVPARRPATPATGPEYLDVPREAAPQSAAPWGAAAPVAVAAPAPIPAPAPEPVAATAPTPAPEPEEPIAPQAVPAAANPAETVGPAVVATPEPVVEEEGTVPAEPVAEPIAGPAVTATVAEPVPVPAPVTVPEAPAEEPAPIAEAAAEAPAPTPLTEAAAEAPAPPPAAEAPAETPAPVPVPAPAAEAPAPEPTPAPVAEDPATQQPVPDAPALAPIQTTLPATSEAPPAPAPDPVQVPQLPQPVGEFVPVDGQAPTTPHLTPTPPHPLPVPPEAAVAVPSEAVPVPPETVPPETAPSAAQPPASAPPASAPPASALPAPPEPVVPAPREAEQDLPVVAEPDAGLVQHADELDTRAADQEDEEPAPAVAETPPAQPVEAAPQDPPSPVPPATTDLPEPPQPQTADAPPVTETTAAPQQPVPPAETPEPTPLPLPAEPAVESPAPDLPPPAPAYDDAEREAVLKVMRERRDIRNGFRADPIPHEVLLRVLEAAHTAPSVGHSQPWDFVVIRSTETRRAMHELATRQRDAYAKSLPKGRAKQFKELKIEAILDTPVNIVVTADPTRGGRHTLGRHTQPQMAPYSSALAVENLWLAARAEGLGVGWVSFFDEREMVRALGLPEHLEVVAYLCVGYVDEFPDEPELAQSGWSRRRPLSWVVHEETYGRRALPGEQPHDLLGETVAQIRPLDAKALGEAWERQKRMTKPAGALGMLEIISAQLAGLSRQCPPPIPEPAAVAIFAGDHGVHAQGVTPWPQEVTAQMVANFLGGGAVCNAFAAQVGAEVCVVDVGVACDLPATPGLLPRKVRAGTADMTTGPAMTREEVKAAIEVGIETARDLVAAGNKALLTGEMGIANTTASAALISVFTDTDPSEVTGRGTGINDETLARKTEVVRRAIELHQPDPSDPIGVLAAVGGLEHAAMVGLLLGGASLRTPVILDGVSAGAAALVARAIAPEVLAACIAGHRSAEPGHVAALNKLGLRPLVDLDLRLGEGTGALLALPMVQSTARAMHEVATFDSAGVTEK
ncbi:nicotinate-nucleotide--dimethylbenzimidazole phosphoribosyltransferase [Streptomyces sp. NPDC048290]|uniref:nicotinate-nucleotide--dimethylbenzimidazole phosphoribosyltransferase n=1 Tax=Streptomyces sp. NPDC048290 TaxID=3155811 RepID=UPI0034324683